VVPFDLSCEWILERFLMPLRTLIDGLRFPEAPRWHEGRLWFSDFYRQEVIAVNRQGESEAKVKLDDSPSGLGWRPDGSLLVVSMHGRRLLAQSPGGELATVADLSAFVGGPCNDMVVDAQGRAYVGNFGFDLYAKEAARATDLLRVDPDGSVHRVASDLWFPNGMAITPDGQTLIVAETFAHRLTAFAIDPDGNLGERRVFADLPGVSPDGLCLDAQGAVWVADAVGRAVLRVVAGQGVVDRVSTGDHQSYACMLGGDDGRTLFICTAPGLGRKSAALEMGRIETTTVKVPHAGRP
jgi:sugar lactone lactonase YvrE